MKLMLIGVVVAGMLCAITASAAEPDARAKRTEWFKDAQWGVFTHYLSDIALKGAEPTVENWNKVVDAFDVPGLVKQLESVGAKYYVITLGQNSGFYCSPNATYDKYVGISPSKCSRRDLIADIYAALQPKGIRLMVYLPAGAPDRDTVAMAALGWKNGKYPRWSHPKGGPDGGDDRLVEFQKKWEAVIREWSTRWGTKVSGWWFDGCYFPIAMYEHPDAPNFASFAAAARAGNPDSIVAFNPGVVDPVISLTKYEDYTAGEINDAEKVKCPGRFVDGAQFQILSFLGPNWGQSPPRYPNETVIAITRSIIDKQGVVTWDVPIQPSGLIAPPFIEQLKALHEGLAKPK
ncbi:MAG: alpha-L-fucosidase [Candidatus Hydrogenedentes bacterium]|nr:alpha-L-fucosidase [Candidatus Hydrogenedentota bacterium]